MVVLDVKLDNFYAFRNFHLNCTYPKKIVDSCIKDEHLVDRPNFRYKKVNIIMGANASGKTTLGRTLMKIFNFIERKNYEFITSAIADPQKNAMFVVDLASVHNIFYRVTCNISPCTNGKYSLENIALEIRQEQIKAKDSYESCSKRLEDKEYYPSESYLEELEKVSALDWLFEYPEETNRKINLPKDDLKLQNVLQNILKALDPSIQAVEKSQEIDNAYVIRLHNKSIILQDGETFDTEYLSSGTKAGVEVAKVVSALIQNVYSFYYCDEKFPYAHSDIEKSILSVMIESIGPNSQLFFTTHNTDVLELNLPKHSFIFLKKNMSDNESPISAINASSLLKRNTDSLKNAVENDLFCAAPSVDGIYDILKI